MPCFSTAVRSSFLPDVARLHGRYRGGEAGHHPARRQADNRGVGGDGAEVQRRRAQGVRAGLYAMAGPGFDPDATLALPTAKIAVMGAEAAVNAVYFNKIEAIEDESERTAYVEKTPAEYDEDIDIVRLASELVVDAVIEAADLRQELVRRLATARGKDRAFSGAGTASLRSSEPAVGPTQTVVRKTTSSTSCSVGAGSWARNTHRRNAQKRQIVRAPAPGRWPRCCQRTAT